MPKQKWWGSQTKDIDKENDALDEKAMEIYYSGKPPLAAATKGIWGCGIAEIYVDRKPPVYGVMLYFKKGEDPVPAGYWMDQPEKEWKGLGLSKGERAQMECQYQVDNYVSKQYWFEKKQWNNTLTEEDIDRAVREGIF
jgi:hypothetical protein